MVFGPGCRTVRKGTNSGFWGSLTSMRNVAALAPNGTQPATDPSHGSGFFHSSTTARLAFAGRTGSTKRRDAPWSTRVTFSVIAGLSGKCHRMDFLYSPRGLVDGF